MRVRTSINALFICLGVLFHFIFSFLFPPSVVYLSVLRFNFISLYLRLIFANEPFFGQSHEAIQLESEDSFFFGLVIIKTHHNCNATHRERIERDVMAGTQLLSEKIPFHSI